MYAVYKKIIVGRVLDCSVSRIVGISYGGKKIMMK